MSDTAFTPGPWRFERHAAHSEFFGNVVGVYGPNARGNEVIRTITCQLGYGPPQENEANARLIAAAPDGYEIAAELVELEAAAEHLPEPMCADLLAIIDKAKAYLAKARGETPDA